MHHGDDLVLYCDNRRFACGQVMARSRSAGVDCMLIFWRNLQKPALYSSKPYILMSNAVHQQMHPMTGGSIFERQRRLTIGE